MAIGALGGALIGGGISALGSYLGGREQADAAENAARMSQFRPTNVTSGYGSVGAEMTGRDVYGNPIYSYTQTLDPRYQAIRDQLLGAGGSLFNQATAYDPMTQGALFTQQLREQAQPSEQQQRTDLENRLFQQGLMGGSQGIERSAALYEAQRRADVQRQMQGYGMAQDTQAQLFNQGLGALQGGISVEGLPGNLMQQSIGASGGQQNAGANAAQFTYRAGQSRGDMISGFFGGLGQGLSNYSFGGGGYNPSYNLDVPDGGQLFSSSGGYGGTGMGPWSAYQRLNMTTLFSMPSPEEVRRSARRESMQEAALFAQPGRGPQMLAAQSGALFGDGIARAAGGVLPEEEKAKKFQMLQQAVMAEFDVDGDGQPDQPTTEDDYLKLTQLTAKHAMKMGMPDIAEQAMARGFQIESTKKPKSKLIGPLQQVPGAPEGTLGQLVDNEWDIKVKPEKQAITTVNNIIEQGESKLAEALGTEYGKQLIASRKDAIDAIGSLESANNAVDLINSGVITGTGAGFITEFGKALNQVGIKFAEDSISNTETFYANQAKQVAQIIKAFGAGTGLSDADREYAERAAAGKITMNEASIRKIIDINARASENVIDRFNSDVDKLPESARIVDLKILKPTFKGAAKKKPKTSMSNDEYEARKKALGL